MDEPVHTLSARGHVVDVLGVPIAYARVVLRRGGEALGEQRTGADGAFAFEPVQRRDNQWPELEASAAGKEARSVGSWRLGDAPVQIVLCEACRLSGRVVDDHGRGLGGVEVVVQRDLRSDRQSTATADDGSFCFAAVAIGATTVMAFRDGWQLAMREIHAGDDNPLEIALAKAHGRTIRFRIHGATPEQLAQAECFLFDTDLRLPDSCLRGRPNGDGVWEKRGLPNEHSYSSLQVTIAGMRCDPQHHFCWAHPESGCYEFEFTMHPRLARPLRGRVLLADGSPLAGVVVDTQSHFGGKTAVVTDESGTFETTTHAPDGEIVGFEIAGCAFVLEGPGLAEFLSPKARDVHRIRMPHDYGDVQLTAVAAARLRLVCTRADGSPAVAAFASVEITWDNGLGQNITSQLATGSTDERGTITFAGLHPQPGAVVAVRVSGDGWTVRTACLPLVAGEVVTVHAVAPPTGGVIGVARDAGGGVVAGESLGVYADDAARPDWAVAGATTDRQGRFRIASLAAGAYRFGGPLLLNGAPTWYSAPFAVAGGATLQLDVVVGAPA